MAQERTGEWLLTEQYHDSSRLGARAALHAQFSTNQQRWFPWVFDHLTESPGTDTRVLELGSGPGWLWRFNQERIPADWQITLSDFSSGMVEEARQNLADVSHPFDFAVVNVEAIPYPSATFDRIIANHMLYHAPDIPAALAEIRRVLKPGGRFYASTLSGRYMRELAIFLPNRYSSPLRFNLDNGAELLAEQFAQVTLDDYANTLVVTEIAPVVDYVISRTPASATDVHEHLRESLTPRIQAYLEVHGQLRLTADAGVFEAW